MKTPLFVTPRTKKTKKEVDVFDSAPKGVNVPYVGLAPKEEKRAVYFTFSDEARELLKLKEGDRLALTTGYENEQQLDTVLFIYKVNDEQDKVDYINSEGKVFKLTVGKYKEATNKVFSTQLYGIMEKYYLQYMENIEGKFKFLEITEEYEGGYFMLKVNAAGAATAVGEEGLPDLPEPDEAPPLTEEDQENEIPYI